MLIIFSENLQNLAMPAPKRVLFTAGASDQMRSEHSILALSSKNLVAITKGKLDFRLWEQIFYGEFDGNRKKRVLVKIIGE